MKADEGMEQPKRGSFQKVRRQDGESSQSNTTDVMGKENRGKGVLTTAYPFVVM